MHSFLCCIIPCVRHNQNRFFFGSLSTGLSVVSSSQMSKTDGGGFSVSWPWTNEVYVFDRDGLHKWAESFDTHKKN